MTTTHYRPEVQAVLDKLRRGHAWLTETHAALLAVSNAGIGSKLEQRFLDGIDRWDSYDLALRSLYGFQGCILGPGQRCPDDSPVSCRGCTAARKERR
ncbi:MAG: hypothetical protein HY531_00375 [Chloroflexi bacterium]|nr:hypothetical protein [Chloroflexota bacterium]